MKKITILLISIIFTLSVQAEGTPSWCKANKLTPVEQTICNSKALGSADTLLNEIYTRVMKDKRGCGLERLKVIKSTG